MKSLDPKLAIVCGNCVAWCEDYCPLERVMDESLGGWTTPLFWHPPCTSFTPTEEHQDALEEQVMDKLHEGLD